MAEKPRERIKQTLLLGFVALGVVLVLLIWTENLSGESGNQGFSRSPVRTPVLAPSGTPESKPLASPTPRREDLPSPGAPSETPRDYEDLEDLGMLPLPPNLAWKGS